MMSQGPIGVYPNSANLIQDPNQIQMDLSNNYSNALSGGLQLPQSDIRDQIQRNNILGNQSQYDFNNADASTEPPMDMKGLFALLQSMGNLPGKQQWTPQQQQSGGQSNLSQGWNMGQQMDFSKIADIGSKLIGMF